MVQSFFALLNMKKSVKIILIFLAVVLISAWVLPMVFKGKIDAIVKKEANGMLRAKFDFEDLDISLLRHFPNASVELKGLTLIGIDQFSGDTLLSAPRISVVVDVMSLFGDEGFEVTKVILSEPSLRAHKLADGTANWDVMKTEDDTAQANEKPSSFRLSIEDVRMNDATIRYVDDTAKIVFATSPADLRMRGNLSALQTDLTVKLTAEQMYLRSRGVTLLHDANAQLNAVVNADLANNKFTFSNNILRLNEIELSLDGWVALQDAAVDMNITAGCDAVRFKDILSLIPTFYTKDFRDLTADGKLTLSVWAKGLMTKDVVPNFEMKLAVHEGSFKYSSLPNAVSDINITARVANGGGKMDQTVIDVSKFGLRIAGNAFSATLHATNLVSDPTFRAMAKGKVDLGAIKGVYPLPENLNLSGLIIADVKMAGCMSDIDKQQYQNIDATGQFVIEQMRAKFKGLPEVRIRRAAATITPSVMTLGELGIGIGKSEIVANGQLTNYISYLLNNGVLSGRLYVKSEVLDLNEIMAQMPTPATPAVAETSAETETAEPMVALKVPKELNLSLNTTFRKILFQKMIISNFVGQLSMAAGTATIEKFDMNLFGGSVAATGSYSTAVNPQRPDLNLDFHVNNASFAKTFKELDVVQKMVPLFEKIGGTYSLDLALKTALDKTMSPDVQTLNATGEIRSANIRVQNIGVFDALAKTLGDDALRTIEAKDVTIRFIIADGRIATQPFDLKMGKINLTMSGSTGLDQTIDYTAKVALPQGAGAGVLQNINVGIGGTFSAPKITLGVKEAVHDILSHELQKLTGSTSLGEEVKKQSDKLRQGAKQAGDKLVEAAQAQRTKLVDGASGTLGKIAAEKAGDLLVKQAEKQAATLQTEAEKQIEKLTTKKQ